jgi:hypothetical protein
MVCRGYAATRRSQCPPKAASYGVQAESEATYAATTRRTLSVAQALHTRRDGDEYLQCKVYTDVPLEGPMISNSLSADNQIQSSVD